VKFIGTLKKKEMDLVNKALLIHLDLLFSLFFYFIAAQ
jgi:hypothetical protein